MRSQSGRSVEGPTLAPYARSGRLAAGGRGSHAASAGVARYQTQTSTLTVSAMGGAYVHTYTITTNPCNDTFIGSGGIASLGLNEIVSGTITGQNISIDGAYQTFNPGYTWHYDGPLSGGASHDSMGQTVPVTFTNAPTSTSNFKNHGDYVSSQGGGSDPAHSCIGMPVS